MKKESERKQKMFGTSEYLVMHEIERARLADRERKRNEAGEPSTTKGPRYKTDKLLRRLTRRR